MIGGVGRAVVSSAVAASSKEISARFLCSSQPPTSSTPALLTRTSPHFSMVTTLVVPDGFAYVPAALMATVFVTAWQSVRVGAARKAAGIAYPQLYAEKAEQNASKAALIFNCTQRAHQNTLELLPLVLITTLVASLTMPVVASAQCGVWAVSRVLYHLGYATGDPAKRSTRGGFLSSIAALTLFGTSTYSAYTLAQSL